MAGVVHRFNEPMIVTCVINKADQVQAGVEELNSGSWFRNMGTLNINDPGSQKRQEEALGALVKKFPELKDRAMTIDDLVR